jgi:predicted nucleic acid-binding protein
MSFDCVVDASVGIKLFLVEPLSEHADALFNHLADTQPARFYVPDLFFIECTNILWKYTRQFGYSYQAAQYDIADLVQLPFQVVPTVSLAEDALQLAVSEDISAYDSAYVVLSRRLSLPLVTADQPLVRRFADSDLDIRSLTAWPYPSNI